MRFIYFGGQQFSDREEKSINSLIECFYEKKCSLINECLPPLYEEFKLRGVLLQYLYENDFNFEKSFNQIMHYIEWKKKNIPFKLQKECFELIVKFNSQKVTSSLTEEIKILDQ